MTKRRRFCPFPLRIGAVTVVLAGLVFLALTGWFGGEVFSQFRARSNAPTPVAAIYLSGDVGPTLGLGSGVIASLRNEGLPVLAINSAAFFNHRRNSTEVEQLLVTALHRATSSFGAQRVIIVGHSFGADMAHVGLARMGPQDRKRIAGIIYIAPSSTVEFSVSPTEMLGLSPAGTDALVTARQAAFAPVSCIYGAEDHNSLCPALALPQMLRMVLPGGHNLRFDSAALDPAIKRAVHYTLTQNSFDEQVAEAGAQLR